MIRSGPKLTQSVTDGQVDRNAGRKASPAGTLSLFLPALLGAVEAG